MKYVNEARIRNSFDLHANPSCLSRLIGGHTALRRSSDGIDRADLREWDSEDPLSSIDPYLSTPTELLVSTYDEERSLPTVIISDLDDRMFGHVGGGSVFKLEAVREVTASIAFALSLSKDPFWWSFGAEEHMAGSSRTYGDDTIEVLENDLDSPAAKSAQLKAAMEYVLSEVDDSYVRVIVISDFCSADSSWSAPFMNLQGNFREVVVVRVFDPWDRQLPAGLPDTGVNDDSGNIFRCSKPENYNRIAARHDEALQAIFAKAGVARELSFEINTAESVIDQLLKERKR